MKSFSVLKCAFQLRIRHRNNLIGQETAGATAKGEIIDKDFNNNELEWYTKKSVGSVAHRLLLGRT